MSELKLLGLRFGLLKSFEERKLQHPLLRQLMLQWYHML
jgi:hypothetical protein